MRSQLTGLLNQQDTICEYPEKGVYTIDMFTKRNTSLSREITQLQHSETVLLQQQSEGKQQKQATAQIIPTTQHILENYDSFSTEEQNRL